MGTVHYIDHAFFPKTDPVTKAGVPAQLQPLNNVTREDCFYGLYDKQLMGRPLTALWAWGLGYLVIAVVADLCAACLGSENCLNASVPHPMMLWHTPMTQTLRPRPSVWRVAKPRVTQWC